MAAMGAGRGAGAATEGGTGAGTAFGAGARAGSEGSRLWEDEVANGTGRHQGASAAPQATATEKERKREKMLAEGGIGIASSQAPVAFQLLHPSRRPPHHPSHTAATSEI